MGQILLRCGCPLSSQHLDVFIISSSLGRARAAPEEASPRAFTSAGSRSSAVVTVAAASSCCTCCPVRRLRDGVGDGGVGLALTFAGCVGLCLRTGGKTSSTLAAGRLRCRCRSPIDATATGVMIVVVIVVAAVASGTFRASCQGLRCGCVEGRHGLCLPGLLSMLHPWRCASLHPAPRRK